MPLTVAHVLRITERACGEDREGSRERRAADTAATCRSSVRGQDALHCAGEARKRQSGPAPCVGHATPNVYIDLFLDS